MVGACASIVLFFPVYKMTFAEGGRITLGLSAMDAVYLSILAIVCTVYAYSASIDLMKKISAFSVNLTVNLEPVYGIILAHPGFYVGAAIILVSVLAHPLLNRIYHRKYLETDNLR